MAQNKPGFFGFAPTRRVKYAAAMNAAARKKEQRRQ